MTIEEIDRRIEELESQTKSNLAEMMKLARAGDPKGVVASKASLIGSIEEVGDLTTTRFGLLLQERASKLVITPAVA